MGITLLVLGVLLVVGGIGAVTAMVITSGDDSPDSPNSAEFESSDDVTTPEPEPELPPSDFPGLTQRFVDSYDVDTRFYDRCDANSGTELECNVIGLKWYIQLFRNEYEADEAFNEFPTAGGEVAGLTYGACDPYVEWERQTDWHYLATPDTPEGYLACFETSYGPEMLKTQEIETDAAPIYALINVYDGDQQEVWNALVSRGVSLAPLE